MLTSRNATICMIKEQNIEVGLKEIEYDGDRIRLAHAKAEVARSSRTRHRGPGEVTAILP
jgi:hypothetical protein